MAKSREEANFENMVETIIFDQEELEELKIAVKNCSEGSVSAKELKTLLLQCRSRMVEAITDFTFYYAKKRSKILMQTMTKEDKSSSSPDVESKLRKEIQERNELLETVAKRVNQLVSNLPNEDQAMYQQGEIKK
jgi:hypothetical protein